MEVKKWTTTIDDKQILLETGKLAEQAHGSITATAGGTVVLATVVIAEEAKENAEFFPLLVEYEERLYAAGKIKGSRWVKREGRPSDEAVLTARLVDRSIRPLFPKDFYHDIQVIITVLSYDEENDPDVLAVLAVSAALIQAGAPFAGPIAASRIIKVDGKLLVNPSLKDVPPSSIDLDLIVASTADRVMMIEAGANEISETEMEQAIKLAYKSSLEAIKIQKEITSAKLKIKSATRAGENLPTKEETLAAVESIAREKIEEITREFDRVIRKQRLDDFEEEVLNNFEGTHKDIYVKDSFSRLVEKSVRQRILKEDSRPDGRQLTELRPISCEVGLLPRTHGSGLFSRGQTQALTIVTLGAPGEVQMIETMEEEGEKRYMHHYNFPPFSTGEAKPIRSTSRREIGHGALAERALINLIPSKESFPYTIRLVSEILSSNGSSSMAAVCGSTLALMDAGVPITKPVAGIAMGLVTDRDDLTKFKVLTDLQGIEDFAGDMDFKVAGTADGITAIQMDTKIAGLSFEIINQTLEQALTGRKQILSIMQQTIPEPRAQISQYAPRITAIKIDPTKIGDIIGPGGKMINKIIEGCGGREIISIDIDEDGTVMVSSTNTAMSEKAIDIIENITREIEIGQIYTGPVVQIIADRNTRQEIGAIVEIAPNKQGMVHISEIDNQRIARVSDVLKIGQEVKVKVLGIDRERGRIQLSIKAASNPNPSN